MSRIRGPILLALLRSADPEERAVAEDEIARALRAEGSIPRAATVLRVARSTLYRITSPAARAKAPLRGPGRPRRTPAT